MYAYLREARSMPHSAMDENRVIAGLRRIVTNVRDCFLVDQLVFLEKQVES